ncbi:hypothetical protein GK091_25510 [Spirosoma agri]|uniref:Uncharacterized protein n=1 Tax=Spirosoma agri TaxID=1987381 RepID=A0A6M0IPF6_9BACT|nr:hypothetical protein [Spirosoma agri]NEU70260.1 hypothetical protein [Spirosoma agri]
MAYATEPEYCPLTALQAWLSVIGRAEGPLFVRIRKGERVTSDRLSDEWVNLLVQQQLG